MDDSFYRRFEERFRGTREVISARLGVYRPLLDALNSVLPGETGVDLGCGRGEWLTHLAAAGFKPVGVDSNAHMLAGSDEPTATIVNSDSLTYLRELADDSVAIISAFHFVEHVPFDVLMDLIQQSLRALKPGGILLLETPNPDNLIVGSSNFYCDPTHERPIPSELLSYLVEDAGFAPHTVWRLNGPEFEDPHILQILRGVSLDYAVLGQKPGSEASLHAVGPVLAEKHGSTLAELAQRYDDRIQELERALRFSPSRAMVRLARKSARGLRRLRDR